MPKKGKQLSELDYFPADVVGLKFDRAAFFTKLRSELKKRTASQNPKLKYAYLCKGMTAPDLIQMTSNMCTAFDNKLSWIDYVFIYEIDAKTPTGAPMIWMECPMVFSPKSLNTFVYYYEKHMEDDYFRDYIRGAITFPAFVLQSALTHAGLNLIHEKSPNFWRTEANAQTVIKAINEAASTYIKKIY